MYTIYLLSLFVHLPDYYGRCRQKLDLYIFMKKTQIIAETSVILQKSRFLFFLHYTSTTKYLEWRTFNKTTNLLSVNSSSFFWKDTPKKYQVNEKIKLLLRR